MRFSLVVNTTHGWILLLCVIPLCLAGLLTIQVTSGDLGDRLIAPAALRQAVFAAIGIAGMFAMRAIGYQRLGEYAFQAYAGCLLLLVWLVLDRWIDMPLVSPQNNMRGWIVLAGIPLQPAELTKIAYVLALASYLRFRRSHRTLKGLIPPFAISLVPMVLIFMQPDLGTVLLFLPVLLAMLFAAGARLRHFAIIALLAGLCLPIFWTQIKMYQRLRIAGVILQNPQVRAHFRDHMDAWDRLRPEGADPADWRSELSDWEARTGYQLVRSKIAVGSGGLLGQGWGGGVFVAYNFLPLKHNDFIFSMIGHQWGLLGALFLLLCYAGIVVIGYDIATLTNDPVGRLLAIGIASMFAVQTLTHVGVTLGLGPVTGVTLPFVSAGGSSMVASFLSIGLLLSVAQTRPIYMNRDPFKFDDEDDEIS